MIKELYGYHISDKIDCDILRKQFQYQLLHGDHDELFYTLDSGGYLYCFSYGGVVFFDVQELDQSKILSFICETLSIQMTEPHKDVFRVDTNGEEYKLLYDCVILTKINDEVIQTLMLNMAQSVTLDYYQSQADSLLDETKKLTTQLERQGHLDIKGKKLHKFIAKALNLKNKITENLYIFDSPDIVWEDEFLNRLDDDLDKIFDIPLRYRSIHENLNIIKENLDLFKDITFHKHSSYLEWIIIILILIEVMNMAIEKIF